MSRRRVYVAYAGGTIGMQATDSGYAPVPGTLPQAIAARPELQEPEVPELVIHEHSPVLELSREGRSWKAKSGRGSVSAPKVILGVNGHIQSFGHFRGRLMHIFTYASMTSAFSQNEFGGDVTGADRWALLPADPMGATVRKITTDGRSRIVIRTRFTYDPSLQVSEKRVADETASRLAP